MYQYVASLASSNIQPVWITKNTALTLRLKKQGVNAYYYKSWLGFYYQIISKVAFVGHSISADLNPLLIGFNTKRVQLWHGVPLKKIGFDDFIYSNSSSYMHKYPKLFSLLKNDRYDLVISTGERCSRLFSSAFNVPMNKIVSTGFPRNDVFFGDEIKAKLDKTYKVIYMPTFRGDIGDSFDLFNGFEVEKIEEMFDIENIELHIRTHPANHLPESLVSKLQNCKRIKISTESDVYESINMYDCLITDYSSVMFDFVISGKPILFAPFDLDDYLEDGRELYFSYIEACGEELYNSWPALINCLLKMKSGPKVFTGNEFLKSFHDRLSLKEKGFSINVYSQVKKLLHDGA